MQCLRRHALTSVCMARNAAATTLRESWPRDTSLLKPLCSASLCTLVQSLLEEDVRVVPSTSHLSLTKASTNGSPTDDHLLLSFYGDVNGISMKKHLAHTQPSCSPAANSESNLSFSGGGTRRQRQFHGLIRSSPRKCGARTE
jgi:hypothetical protein